MNAACEMFGTALEVRFYGHYGDRFDAGILTHIPAVAWLSIDSLTEITNAGQIAKLAALKHLSFGVYLFDEPNFLEELDVGRFTQLSLGGTAKQNVNLAPLRRATALKALTLGGFTKNIEVVGSLPKLTQLRLTGISKSQSLRFVGEIPNLRSLYLLLGGRQSIDEIAHHGLEELSIVRVRGLEELGVVGRFPGLRTLVVEDQLQVRSVDVAGLSLRKLVLVNCKNLAEIQGLEQLRHLVEFRTAQTKLDLESLLEREWPPSMEVVALYAGSRKWNESARAALDKRGFREFASG